MDGQFIGLHNDYSYIDISNKNKEVMVSFVAGSVQKVFYNMQDQCYGN